MTYIPYNVDCQFEQKHKIIPFYFSVILWNIVFQFYQFIILSIECSIVNLTIAILMLIKM